jgi:type IX secretion system PorP/SprF family membrane protein
MKRILLFIPLFLLCFEASGQQDALFSQYMFNPFAINPAYAGSRNSMSAVLLHRSQWVGISGAPNTQTFAVHSKIKESGIAVGGNFSHDKIGPSRNFFGALTGGYHVKMPVGHLSFAVRGGVYNSILDNDAITFDNPNDQFQTSGKQSAFAPSFDFGAYYYSNRFYAGLSVNHLTKHELNFAGFPTDASIFLKRHYMLNTGAVFLVNENIALKPSILFRYAEGAPPSLDVNFSMLFKQFWWIGLSLRNLNSLVILTEFNITDYLRAGYSFDLSLNELRNYNFGSHELFIGFDFVVGKNKNISPRYL